MFRVSHATARALAGGVLAAFSAAAALVSAPATAAVQQFFITGEVSSLSSYTGLAVGTPFAGTYQFDDATADTNADAQMGSYATGQYFVDFGPATGQITFDQGGSTSVRDSVAGFGGFTTDDVFTISAGPGARNTPGIPNDIQGSPSLLFRQALFGSDPTALGDDTLTGVPHVAGAPWDPDDQLINLQLSAVGGGCPAFTSSCFMRLDVDTVDPAFTLDVNTTGTGSGSVASAPFGIDCGATCSAQMGGTVVLTAVPVDSIVIWTGCDSVNPAGDQCTVDMNANRTVTAEFVAQFNLTVNKTGTGSGTVTSNPAGIDCGATCSALFDGTVVLTATPVDSIVIWTGCDSVNPAGDQCTVDMNADRTVTAEFVAQFNLTVNKTGTGSGTVTSNPAGIDCGATCSAALSGTVVLTAVPVDSTVSWTGCDSVNPAGDQCTVDMNADRTVTAQFDAIIPTFNLTVNKTGTGGGTITSTPAGIDCGATCSAPLGGTVVLTATPVDSSVSWAGCDSVNPAGDQCTVDMNADRTVTAQFHALVLMPIPLLSGTLLGLLGVLLALLGVPALRGHHRR